MPTKIDIQNKQYYTPVPSGAEFYAISKIFNSSEKNLVFVSRDNKRSKEIYDSLKNFIHEDIIHFPAWDTQPYDLLSPSQEILHKRISSLYDIIHSKNKQIIVTSYETLAQKIICKDYLTEHGIKIALNQNFSRDNLIKFLINNGYRRSTTANDPGEFAVRGSILDIYANGYKHGHRIDFFGNKVELIKSFDPATQITISKVDSFTITPPTEIILTQETTECLQDKLIAQFGTKALNDQFLEKLKQEIRPIGVEQYYSLLYKGMSNLFNYANDANYIFDFLSLNNLENYLDNIDTSYDYRQQHGNNSSITIAPSELYLSSSDLAHKLDSNTFCFYEDSSTESNHTGIKKLPNINAEAKSANLTVFQYLIKRIRSSELALISATTEGSKDRIRKIFSDHDLELPEIEFDNKTTPEKSGIFIAPFTHGFQTEALTLITENDIFGERIKSVKIKKNKQVRALIEQAYNFSPGELVVHQEHGIGKFTGLTTIEVQGTKHDCLELYYAGNDKLFVPVENIDLITKYGLDGDFRLDKLGGASWQSRKAKIKNRLKLSADYLVNIAAKRATEKAEIITPRDGLFEEFCASFPYVETDDQLNAINDVIDDLKKGTPMDRLICGDVGFGKTEVALRASFVVAKTDPHERTQIALFCPTTLLCRQHYKSFAARLSKFGIKVAQLSRLVKPSEANSVIEEINSGAVDVVIGTHALLNSKIKFKNLGLLIIDEEQHFGVAQKEKLKELRSNVHVLTLSATPIPRTLQMSLTGIKELSLIATPPVNRLVTKTSILSYDPAIIKEALMREFYRGGQSFYVCPRISDIKDIEQQLQEIVPELKYVVAHGQMQPSRLDEIMNDFYDGKYNILLSTTIIESGLDIPTANTLIVHKAEKFGLSQLYQLRGRVGRSNIAAYAYFTLPNSKKLKFDTVNRLEILQNIDTLGAGFSVATHDMDTRGFGNLLGDEQSGQIKEVGVELYQELLKEEVKKIQASGNDDSKQEISPQINIGLSSLIPDKYINDIDVRLSLYRRVAAIKDNEEIEEFAAEMIDRFGPIPNEFENLLSIIKLKNLSRQASILKIEAGPKAILFEIDVKQLPDPQKMLNFILSSPKKLKLRSNNEILLFKSELDTKNLYQMISNFLNKLIAQ